MFGGMDSRLKTFGPIVRGLAGLYLGTAATTTNNILDIVQNQNAGSHIGLLNNNGGVAAYSSFRAYNGTHQADIGIFGTAYATNGVLAAHRTFIQGSAGLALASGAGEHIYFGTNGVTETMRLTSAGVLCVGVTAPASTEQLCVGTNGIRSMGGIRAGDNSIFTQSNSAGSITIGGAASLVTVLGSGITCNLSSRGIDNNDYIDIIATSGGVRLAAGAGTWVAISERAKKRDFEPIPGDPFKIIAAHRVELGRYIADQDDAQLKPFLFYEDAILAYPWATVTMPERTSVHSSIIDGEEVTHEVTDPEYKGLSLEQYVPLLMLAFQKQIAINADLTARLTAQEQRG